MKTIANIMIINSQNVKPEHQRKTPKKNATPKKNGKKRSGHARLAVMHHNISYQRRKLCLRQDEFQRSCQH